MLNKPYLSIQEMVEKTEKQRRAVEDALDSGKWHPEDASILDDQKAEDRYLLKEALEHVPLREYMQRKTTLGDYLVADKVHTDLQIWSNQTDKVPLISSQIINGWDGADLVINIVDPATFRAQVSVSGSAAPSTGVGIAKATLSPKLITLQPGVAGDLSEDSAVALIPWCLERAALAVGRQATDLALTKLKTATDGWGTVNGGASGDSGATKWDAGTTWSIHNTTQSKSLMNAFTVDRWIPNTMVLTTEAWQHSMHVTLDALANNINLAYTTQPMPVGYDFRINTPPPLDCIFWDSAVTATGGDAPGTAMTACVTILFDRSVAMLTGRKRWMELKNYVDPIKDIGNMIVSCRQDSVTCYDDAIGVITETA